MTAAPELALVPDSHQSGVVGVVLEVPVAEVHARIHVTDQHPGAVCPGEVGPRAT